MVWHKLSIRGHIVVTLALSRVFVPDHQGHPVCSCTFLLLRTALRRRGGVEGGVLVDPPERGRRREVGVAAGDAHRALAAQRATRAEPARTRRPLAQALQVRIQFGEESTACGHRIPHRKWKQFKQHVAWLRCAWVLLSFFPYPVGHPMSAGCICYLLIQ